MSESEKKPHDQPKPHKRPIEPNNDAPKRNEPEPRKFPHVEPDREWPKPPPKDQDK